MLGGNVVSAVQVVPPFAVWRMASVPIPATHVDFEEHAIELTP
jgi:hypothetical protein